MSKDKRFDKESISNVSSDDSSTVEMDKYSLLRQVGYDTAQKTEQKTVRMSVPDAFPTIPITAIGFPTVPMPAVNFDASQVGTLPIDTDMIVEIDVEMELLDNSPTAQIPVRMEFEAVIEPGGILRIPKKIMDSGHVRPGIRLQIIAAQKE